MNSKRDHLADDVRRWMRRQAGVVHRSDAELILFADARRAFEKLQTEREVSDVDTVLTINSAVRVLNEMAKTGGQTVAEAAGLVLLLIECTVGRGTDG